ncbi:unnamed protein product, partial [Durusdinium trenchii]
MAATWRVTQDMMFQGNFRAPPVDFAGKTVAITGPSRGGIGYETAQVLAERGATVLLCARNLEKAEKDATAIMEETGKKPKVFKCDVSSLASARACAEEILKEHPVLDVLINNAGAVFDESGTVDEVEITFATCALGHHLLNFLLQPRRIVWVTGDIYAIADGSGNPHFKGKGIPAYANACLARLRLAKETKRRGHCQEIIAVHPGVIRSQFIKPKNCCESCCLSSLNLGRISVLAGAQSSIYAATCPSSELPEDTIYFHNKYGWYVLKPKDLAMDAEKQRELFDQCEFFSTARMTTPRKDEVYTVRNGSEFWCESGRVADAGGRAESQSGEIGVYEGCRLKTLHIDEFIPAAELLLLLGCRKEFQLLRRRLEVERELTAAQEAQLGSLRETIAAVRQQVLQATRENTELRSTLASQQEILRQLRRLNYIKNHQFSWFFSFPVTFMLKFHGTFSGVTALALALAEEECHGVLAGPECCEVEDLEDHQILQKPWRDQILQDNMVKFGKVGGDGSHRYESSLNPALCERDLQDLRAENPNFFAPRGHAARREAFEACARRNARLVELHVDLEMAGDCSMHYVGDFCSPFSCAVVYEKWILSAQYFIENFPQCATFALQPCIWQNAAQMHRVSSLQQLPELFEALELTLDTDLERDKEVQTLLTTLENLSDDLLPWPLLRPFADAAALGRKRLRLSRPPQKLLESGIPVILDLLAPAIQTLLCEEMGCQPFLDESLLAGATRLRPRWRELGSLCAAGQFQRAAELERRYAGETERWVAALAQLGHDVPPDFLLSFQELCNLLGRSHASPTRSPLSRDICGESTVPAVEPTGCSCRTWGVHDAPLDFLMNFDLSLTPGETDRVLLLPPAHLALYPLTTRTRRRLQGAKVKVIEVPWIEPPGVSPTVAQRNQENHFGNREYIRLHAMNLDYDVVVYLDTDVRIVGDLNPIFEEGQDLFVSTGSTVAPLDGGFFAVRPSGALFRAMLDVLRTVHYDRETGWNRMGHGYSLALGRAEGNYPAGPQGFLYHFFYMADPAVDLALKRNGAVRPRSAQVDSCQWNYNSFHGSFKWRYLDESSYFAAMPEEWRRQVESFHRRVTWTFPCDFTVKKPVLVHHMDEAIEGYLEHLQQQHPNQTTVLLPR